MAKVKNISQGPRGAWREVDGKMVEVWADPGQIIEADDFAAEWFKEVDGDEEDTSKLNVPNGGGSLTAEEKDDLLLAALESLEVNDELHWTNSGLPQVEFVNSLLPFKASRADITRVAPDLKRPD